MKKKVYGNGIYIEQHTPGGIAKRQKKWAYCKFKLVEGSY